MRNRVNAPKVRYLCQAASIALLAGFVAACSDTGRQIEPLLTGSTAARPTSTGTPLPPAPVGGAVTNAALPAPAGTNPVNLGSGSGSGWTAVGGQVVTVAQGESLDTLAMKYGVPSNEIAKANGVSSPAQIFPGRALVIPRQTQTAYAPTGQPAQVVQQVAEPIPTTEAPQHSGGVHTVAPGETLYSISRTYGVSVSQIVSANSLSSESIRVGQRLTVPGAGGTAPAQPQGTQVASLSPSAGAAPKPLGTMKVDANGNPVPVAPVQPAASATPQVQPPATAAAPVDEVTDPPSANGTTFRWPVRGRIIAGFGTQSNGERNDGINLAVPAGTPVKATEAGTVIYAGNELAGYGNLVLVRHADGWVSAYAHNSEILVSRGDTVQRGSTIGKAGTTGSVDSPQVHFELRKGAKPVNPMDYLSSNG